MVYKRILLALDIKVQDADVVNQNGKWPICQVSGGLTQDLIQHCAVGLC